MNYLPLKMTIIKNSVCPRGNRGCQSTIILPFGCRNINVSQSLLRKKRDPKTLLLSNQSNVLKNAA